MKMTATEIIDNNILGLNEEELEMLELLREQFGRYGTMKRMIGLQLRNGVRSHPEAVRVLYKLVEQGKDVKVRTRCGMQWKS